MDRTYVVTGAASGIGAATAAYLRERGDRVIACDLHNADVIADLATIEGRAALVEGVKRISGGRIDAIVANAGGGPPQTSLSLNFFGAVATLEGLRPLLAESPAPRAVAVSSIASFSPVEPAIVEACLALDEKRANGAGLDFATKIAPHRASGRHSTLHRTHTPRALARSLQLRSSQDTHRRDPRVQDGATQPTRRQPRAAPHCRRAKAANLRASRPHRKN